MLSTIPDVTSWSLEEMGFSLKGYEHQVIQVDYGLLFIGIDESLSL